MVSPGESAKKPKHLITPDDVERVRAAIEAAERATAGEIRVAIVPRAARASFLAGTIASLLAGFLSYLWMLRESWGTEGWLEALDCVGIGVAVGFATAWLLPRCAPGRSAQRRAEREFASLGIARTAGRTGVLILLARAERRAVLLADRAIHERVLPGAWDGVIQPLTSAIRDHRAADGLVEAVERVGRILAEHFPKRPGHINELPDEVVES